MCGKLLKDVARLGAAASTAGASEVALAATKKKKKVVTKEVETNPWKSEVTVNSTNPSAGASVGGLSSLNNDSKKLL